MRFPLSLLLVALISFSAFAQCPGGRCPTAGYSFVPQFYPNQVQVVAPVRSKTVVRQRVVQEQLPAALIAPVQVVVPTALVQSVACPCNGNCNCNNNQNCGCTPQRQVVVNATNTNLYSLDPGGPVWAYYGNNLAGHLAQVHGVDPSGMNHQQMVAAHSRAHNASQVSRTVVKQSTGIGPVRRIFGH